MTRILTGGVNYPVLTKAVDSFIPNWKQAVHICNNETELRSVVKQTKAKSLLFQEYIKKKDEYILQGISINGGEVIYIPIEGGYYRLPEGAYGTYLWFRSHKSNDMDEKLKKMFKKIGYNGVFEIEFLVGEDNQLYFLEINFRHTLWNHTFTQMGVNLCKIWSDSIRNGRLIIDGAYIQKEPFKLITEFSDFKQSVRTRKISFFQWLKDVICADSHVNYDPKDPLPYFALIKQMLFK